MCDTAENMHVFTDAREGGTEANNEKRKSECQSPVVAFSGYRHFGIINLLTNERSIYYACVLWNKPSFQSFFFFFREHLWKGTLVLKKRMHIRRADFYCSRYNRRNRDYYVLVSITLILWGCTSTKTIQDNKIKEILSSVKKEVSHQADRIIKQS